MCGSSGYAFADNINYKEGNSVEMACCETTATTTFVDDGAHVEASYESKVDTDDISIRCQSISDFMAKPLLVSTYSWTTSGTADTIVASGYPGATIVGQSYWSNKLEGFDLWRGTCHIRVQINANPFQQGKLLLHFLPIVSATGFGSTASTGVDPSYLPMHNSCLAAKRQQPCVEIDCRDSVGILSIPYIAPSNWFSKKLGYYEWGKWFLTILSPLNTGASGETTVDVTVYMHFTDFEMAGPMVPQMRKASSNKYRGKVYSRKDMETEELEAIAGGSVSGALRSVSNTAGALSEIPLLGPVAREVSWASGVASQVASALGWSKPLNNVEPHIISNQFNRYAGVSDGPDNLLPLGLISDNKTKVTDGLSVYKEDEMSWNFLKKVCTYVGSVTWHLSDISGTSLYTNAIHPRNLYQSGTTTYSTHTTAWRCGPPIFYFGSDFALWRGSIKVMVKIVKTDFHTGRLQLTWTPTTTGTTVPTTTTGLLALREIIDLRSGNEFEFTLPWLLGHEYRSMGLQSGFLDITVLNELRGPETTASTVDILIYYCGGDDLEFAGPMGSALAADMRTVLPFSPQVRGDDEVIEEGVGGEPVMVLTTKPSERSIGETFLSVKQLLNRASFVCQPSIVTSTLGLRIWPNFRPVLYMNSSTGALVSGYAGGDYYCKASPCYAMFRGSTKLQIMTVAADTVVGSVSYGRNAPILSTLTNLDPAFATSTSVIAASPTDYYTSSDWGASGITVGSQGYNMASAGNGIVGWRIPYHSKYKCSLAMSTQGGVVGTDASQPVVGVIAFGTGAFNGGYITLRSFADDFQLSYFVGCPPQFWSFT